MSFDLFVYGKAIPANFIEVVSAELAADGYTLPVKLTTEDIATRIDIGSPYESNDEINDGITAWAVPLKHEGSRTRQQLVNNADKLGEPEISSRLRQAEYELHFSNQYLSGPHGGQLIYLAAAAVSIALDQGVYCDPQEDGFLEPAKARDRAKYWSDSHSFGENATSGIVAESAAGRKNANPWSWALILLFGLWALNKFHNLGYF